MVYFNGSIYGERNIDTILEQNITNILRFNIGSLLGKIEIMFR